MHISKNNSIYFLSMMKELTVVFLFYKDQILHYPFYIYFL